MSDWLGWVESPRGRGPLSYGPLRRLHGTLIEPLQPYLPLGGAVVVAPFGELHLLPLGAALDPASGRYAIENYRLGFAPSLAALRVVHDQAQQGSILGGQEELERVLSVAYPGIPGSDFYLTNAVPEAEVVTHHFSQVTLLVGEAATPNAVLANARGQDVIHLSCHGWFDFEEPEQSGLLLSGGWLTVQRILTEMHLNQTRLVTLSAGASALMQVRRGEEHIGLTQAMMIAGARAVVASLWPVDDSASRVLFEAFYTDIAAGSPPVDALTNAARLVRSHPSWEHPYYWAGFTVSGLAYGPAHLPTNRTTHHDNI